MTLIERLQVANEDSHACWCRHCGRTILYRPAKKSGAEVISEGDNWDCRASMEYAPLDEIIAAIKVRDEG